jgi:hypothetical protein
VPQDSDSDVLQLIPFMRPAEEMTTRADNVPDGYQPFLDVYKIPKGTTISFGIFMTEAGDASPAKMGLIRYNGEDANGVDQWRSAVEVKQKDYYVYGFLPAEAAEGGATVTPYNGDFANGAMLTIKDMPAVSTSDVCVITGVQDASSADAAIDLHLGRFAYHGKPKGQNYVGVLIDHLFSEIEFKFQVNPDYYALRRIKLTKLTLKATGRDKVTATVPLVANTTGQNPMGSITTISPTGSNRDVVLFENTTGKDITIDAEAFGEVRGFSAPAASNTLSISCEYDVYDTDGNLVRQGCKAENNLSMKVASLKPGEKSEVTVIIRPTYLYVLSEPDLDNPTIVVN